jgi:hypothetical protein
LDPLENKTSPRDLKSPELRGFYCQIVCKKMGKLLVVDLLNLISKFRTNDNWMYMSCCPFHKLGFQAINFLYRNNLIDQLDLASLIKEENLQEASENMILHSIFGEVPLSTRSLDDIKNIFNSWFSSQARELYESKF